MDKKKGKKYTEPKPKPDGYKAKPNDKVLDYTQVVARSKFPRKRKRYLKVDGFDIEIKIEPDARPRKGEEKNEKKKDAKNAGTKKGTRKGGRNDGNRNKGSKGTKR